MNRIKGILYAAVSSSTFWAGSVFFYHFAISRFFGFRGTFLSLGSGVDCIDCVWLVIRLQFSIGWKRLGVVFLLSLLRAVTSFSLIIAYQNIASGVASTIHFMYPLAVALAMMFFFREKKSLLVILAVLMSLLGAALLSLGELEAKSGNTMVGLVAACVSVFFIRRVYCWSADNASRTNKLYGIDLLCYGVGNHFFTS